MTKINVEFIENSNYETNEAENTCLITQLMQYITIIGLKVNKLETPFNNGKGVLYEKIA